jgi:hypothetical protein
MFITRNGYSVHHGDVFAVPPRAGDLDAKNFGPNVAEQSHKLRTVCPAKGVKKFSYANSVSGGSGTVIKCNLQQETEQVSSNDMVKVRKGNEAIAWSKQVAGRYDSRPTHPRNSTAGTTQA